MLQMATLIIDIAEKGAEGRRGKANANEDEARGLFRPSAIHSIAMTGISRKRQRLSKGRDHFTLAKKDQVQCAYHKAELPSHAARR